MRLFFHFRRDGALIEDQEGEQFETIQEARTDAILTAREMLAERIFRGEPVDDLAFDVADEAGTVLLSISFLQDAIVRRR